MSQQFVEAKLKEGKTDMQLFTNKRLKDERQEKGRNYQVMAKGRERVAVRKRVQMPMGRNERRQLGDGSKVAEQTIERARRRGQLVSRSKQQIEAKLAKLAPSIGRVYLAYKEKIEQLTSLGGGADSAEEPGAEPGAEPGPSKALNIFSNSAAGIAMPLSAAARSAAVGGGAGTAEEAGAGARGGGQGRGTGAVAVAGRRQGCFCKRQGQGSRQDHRRQVHSCFCSVINLSRAKNNNIVL
jgi:hypothetical protein